MKEYGELEKQMKTALANIEKREKNLSTSEQEVNLNKCFSLLQLSISSRFNECKLI